MQNIIDQATQKIKKGFEDFFSGEDISIDKAEITLTQLCFKVIGELLGELYEEKDRQIREDKESRRGKLTVERRNDRKSILTVFGEVNYSRTYYRKASGGYDYPVDSVVGIDSHERLSYGTAMALVDCARYESYGKSSEHVLEGKVSRQTVMNKLREAQRHEEKVCDIKKKIPVLHIDADEDHVAMQDGRNVQVPLATIYEGVDRSADRHRCINAFSVSRYGLSSEEFWQEVYTEIDNRYDLTNTKVYLHGDGAEWIQEGLEWLPRGTVFVRDRYHVSKYILTAVSGMEEDDVFLYQRSIRSSLKDDNSDRLADLMAKMLEKYPDREETIVRGIGYLINFFDAIHIKYIDKEARCGSSEPHVQHVLSQRLSTIPMGWSDETLKHLVPLLSGSSFYLSKEVPEDLPVEEEPGLSCEGVNRMIRKLGRKKIRNSLGMTDPDKAVCLPATQYKKTTLGKILMELSRV